MTSLMSFTSAEQTMRQRAQRAQHDGTDREKRGVRPAGADAGGDRMVRARSAGGWGCQQIAPQERGCGQRVWRQRPASTQLGSSRVEQCSRAAFRLITGTRLHASVQHRGCGQPWAQQQCNRSGACWQERGRDQPWNRARARQAACVRAHGMGRGRRPALAGGGGGHGPRGGEAEGAAGVPVRLLSAIPPP